MWLFIWVVLSSIVLGSTLWSLKILMDQKSAWEKFAKAKSFVLNKGTFTGPAEMNGMIGAYKFSFFTAERDGEDIKNRRLMTVLEMDLADGLVDGCVMGTQKMLPFMQSLQKLHPFVVETAPWDAAHFVFARNDAAVKAYLTPERLDILAQILKTKNADVVVLFNDSELLVRMETTDPMKNVDKLDKIVARLMTLVDKLRITPDERARLQALAPPAPPVPGTPAPEAQ